MEWVKQYGILLLVGLVGVGILLYGFWEQVKPGEVKVEIVKSGEATPTASQLGGQVVVDVAGAVESPGVYKLPSGSRIGDALVAAGGLSAQADREWVAKTLNLAKEIKDQEKVYIPTLRSSEFRNGAAENLSEKVNINTASEEELDKLSGIGTVRAQAIIANRPYGSVEELVSKAKIPQSVYEKLKDQISVY
ncbi:MAG: ComEA family DNA-binding protein [bacterium]